MERPRWVLGPIALTAMGLAGVATAQPSVGELVDPWLDEPVEATSSVAPPDDPIDPWRSTTSKEEDDEPLPTADDVVDPWRGVPLHHRAGELIDPWPEPATQPPTAAFPVVRSPAEVPEPASKALTPPRRPGSCAAFPLVD